jgi:hypothetical protein
MSFLLKQGSTAVASSLSMASVSSYTFIAVDAATWGGNLSRSLAAHPRVQILSQMDDRSLTGPRTVNMPPKILQKIPQARKEAIWVRVSFVMPEGVFSRNTLRHERRGKDQDQECYTHPATSRGLGTIVSLHSNSQTLHSASVEACQEFISRRGGLEERKDGQGVSLSRKQKNRDTPSTRIPVLLLLLDFAVVVQAFAFAKSGLARSPNPCLASLLHIHISCSQFLAT